jgi:hypothetical protein
MNYSRTGFGVRFLGLGIRLRDRGSRRLHLDIKADRLLRDQFKYDKTDEDSAAPPDQRMGALKFLPQSAADRD